VGDRRAGRGPRLRTDLLAAALIVAAAVVLGLLQNSLSAEPLSLIGATAESAATSAPLKTPEDVRNALAQGRAVLIDSRDSVQYEAGHLKGALSVPFSEREKRYAELLRTVPSSTRLIVYCDQGCDAAPRLAAWLRSKGWADVTVFTSGYSAWAGAGLPVSTGAQP
jgi:rhodanese-related sulfurtransferase